MFKVAEGVYINIHDMAGFTEGVIYMNDGTIIELIDE